MSIGRGGERFRAAAAVMGTAVLCAGLAACASPAREETPAVPEPRSPLDGSGVAPGMSVRFAWAPAARAAHYDFRLSERGSGGIERRQRTAISAEEICTAAECAVTLPASLPIESGHAWSVRAGNAAGKSAWTSRRFSVVEGSTAEAAARVIEAAAGSGRIADEDAPAADGTDTEAFVNPRRPPDTPEPLAPIGETLARGELTPFVWRPADGATAYDFHLFDRIDRVIVDEVRGLPAATVCQTDERCVLSRAVTLPPSGEHVWRVQAINRDGRSEWARTPFAVGD